MFPCLFVSDMHGKPGRYSKLFDAVAERLPRALFIGGDFLPGFDIHRPDAGVLRGSFLGGLARLREKLGGRYPRVFVIFGNDDGRWGEEILRDAERDGLLSYIHGRKEVLEGWTVYGYSFVPPSPFLLKDWERYDAGFEVAAGSVPPDAGILTVPRPSGWSPRATMADDLRALAADDDLGRAVFLFHAPPFGGFLDRLDRRRMSFGHATNEVHVGSVAIRRFIERRSPLLTLHGHLHESPRVSGHWRERIGRTLALSAAHDGPELALVSFDLDDPENAGRDLL